MPIRYLLSNFEETKYILYNMADEIIGYDEQAEVKFIRNHIPQELKELVTDDDLVYFGDLIYEFFESRGIFAEDEMEDEADFEFDEEELYKYVLKNARKDEVGPFGEEQILFIVQAEMAYYESIGVFE